MQRVKIDTTFLEQLYDQPRLCYQWREQLSTARKHLIRHVSAALWRSFSLSNGKLSVSCVSINRSDMVKQDFTKRLTAICTTLISKALSIPKDGTSWISSFTTFVVGPLVPGFCTTAASNACRLLHIRFNRRFQVMYGFMHHAASRKFVVIFSTLFGWNNIPLRSHGEHTFS